VYANTQSAFSQDLLDLGLKVNGSDDQAIKEFNAFLRDMQKAYDAYKSAEIADPRYGANKDIIKASMSSMESALTKLYSSDNMDVRNITVGGVAVPGIGGTINSMNADLSIGNYSMMAVAVNSLSSQLDAIKYSGGSLTSNDISLLGSIFSSTATPQTRDAINTVMSYDISKMVDKDGNLLNWDHADKQIALLMQRTVGELQEAYNNYASEKVAPVGTAASDVLHISANYSRSLGGKEASEINVNYVEINTKNLGMGAQDISSQKGSTRAIDQLDEVIKVVSGNRASIGTYINRLEYTVNNIASMTYNTQEAESRIRDTDFSKETTEFTKNQIMVQSATSILAQANSLPQSVLALIG
jgi:flagellin-like hook-associated protein FlgL